MNLSNFRIFVFLIFVCVGALSCGGEPDANTVPQVSVTPTTNLPFDAREPAEFQADIFIRSGESALQRRYYRKGERWRLDIFEKGELARSIISSDEPMLFDHAQKLWTATNNKDLRTDPEPIRQLTSIFENKRYYSRFEDLGIEGSVRRYRVFPEGVTSGRIILHYDENLKMIVRQEIFEGDPAADAPAAPVFTFELKDVNFAVNDEVFAVPAGYRRITEEQFHKEAAR